MRFAAVVVLALAPMVNGITNGDVPASNDTRFDAVGAFAVSWRLGFDQGSHSDDADHAWFCSATLVNAQQIQVARHCLVAYGSGATYMVRFRRREDGGLGSVGSGVSSFFHMRIASWDYIATGQNEDLAIGQLADPVYHITAIPLSVESVSTDEPIIQAGWGREGPGSGNGQAVQLKTCANHISGTLLSEEWIKYPSPDQQDYGYNACGVNTWDSGGPALAVDACGNFRVIASHLSPLAGDRITQAAQDAAPPDVFYRCGL